MDLTALLANVPAAPHPLPLPAASVSPADRLRLPLAQRFTLTPTISAKANYYDLAQTARAPYDLRSALIWLCLCAHDNSVWWAARTPDHQDGTDAPPLPLALDFAAWMRYIQDWQNAHFSHTEDADVQVLALRVWIGAHETAVIPNDDKSGQKKTPPPPGLTGQNSAHGSSHPETPFADTTPSTQCPSATSTPPCTHGSLPMASQLSAPENPPAETPRSTPSSPPPPQPPDARPFWVAEVRHPIGGTPSYASLSAAAPGDSFVPITTDIHCARRFSDYQAAAVWICEQSTPGNWIPTEHICQ